MKTEMQEAPTLVARNGHREAPPRFHERDDAGEALLDVEQAHQAADLIERSQATEALRESERRFRQMIDALPAAIYTTDAEGRLTHFNPAAVEFSGRTPELGTDSWCVSWKLFYPDGRPMPHDECPMAIALKEGRIVRGAEAIAERPDGKRVWFNPYPTPLRDAEGKIVGGINMLVDITERKLAEEARGRLAAIVQWSDDAIVSKDLDGIITSWNSSAERIFGYSAQEAIGQPVTMLIPADRRDEERGILERIRRGESVDHYETVRCRKDGTLLDISLTISPIADSQGRIVGASKIARDISAQIQARLAISESEARFRQLADSMPQIVWAARPDGCVDYYNERWYEYTGFPRDQFGQSGWERILHPADAQRCIETYFRCVREGKPYQIEYRFKDRETGGYRWFMGRALPIRNDAGEIVRWFGTCTDIDDQKRAEERLEAVVQQRTAKLQEALGELEAFSYSVAHDLRAPLRAMEGYASELLNESSLSVTGQMYLQRIQRAAARLDRLTQEVLSYSRVSREEAKLGRLDLDRLAHEVVEQYPELSALRQNIEIRSPLLPVWGHEALLTQALANLLVNACKFVAPGVAPKVVLQTVADKDNVRIWVEDDGIGIAPEHRDWLFKIFGRIHPEHKYPGTGIGLAIVKKAAERMGGTVGFESEPGQGSRFWVQLGKAC
jgi:PAS domain S-box-containing protein